MVMNKETAQRLKSWLLSRIPLLGIFLRRRALRELTADGSPLALEIMASALDRLNDPAARALIRQRLEAVQDARQVDGICRAWAETRSTNLGQLISLRGWVASAPPALRILSALQAGQLSIVQAVEASELPVLLETSTGADPILAGRARQCLCQLTSQTGIDALCAEWVSQRSSTTANGPGNNPLESILTESLTAGGYVASQPAGVRVLSALHNQAPQSLSADDAAVAQPLAAALHDSDPLIAVQARKAIALLANRSAQEAICQAFLRHPDQDLILQESILSGGYLPQNPAQRALFFFLTDQWERYESLDYDHSQLRAIYDTGDAPLRERITSRLRQAGRPSYLTILVGGDEASRLKQMSPTEIELMLQILQSESQWPRLWYLASRLPLVWSLQIVRNLHKAGWQPPDSADDEVYTRLRQLCDQPAINASRDIARHMLPAVQRAQVRLLHGRLNDLAFAPNQAQIALGTSRRRVVLWDYHTGQVLEKISAAQGAPFNHSIGEVAYTRQGDLVFAERSLPDVHCRVYRHRRGESQAIHTETGAVTALKSVGENRVLLCGRSQFATLLDLAGPPVQVQRRVFTFWARSACVHPTRPLAALLHQSALLVSLPDLQPVVPGRAADEMINCGEFLPASEDLLVGKLNGECMLLPRHKASLGKPELLKPLQHQGRVTGLAALQTSPTILSAGADGVIQFMSWPDKRPTGQIGKPGEKIQSIHLSPDQSYLAVAHSESSLTLWDLRIQTLPAILNRPLLEATPNHLTVLRSLTLTPPDAKPPLSPAGTRALSAAILLLQHRLRHDIEIDQVEDIKMGEFDIEIE